MKHILAEIVKNKKQELPQIQRLLQQLQSSHSLHQNKPNQFYDALTTQSSNMAIIAEVKMQSPSNGAFVSSNYSVTAITQKQVKLYTESGADAISLVTDQSYFGGSYSMIQTARQITALPILQKDFIIDQSQLYLSQALGAHALLLIARILSSDQLSQFIHLAFSLNLEPVVEVYSEDDLAKVLSTSVRVIGVNARNLDTFVVDQQAACAIIAQIPSNIIAIGFSGIKTRSDVINYHKSGAKAVLVGSSLMLAQDPRTAILSLKS